MAEVPMPVRPATCDHREVYRLAFDVLAPEMRFVGHHACPDCGGFVMDDCSVIAALQVLTRRAQRAESVIENIRRAMPPEPVRPKPPYETLTRDEYRAQDHGNDPGEGFGG